MLDFNAEELSQWKREMIGKISREPLLEVDPDIERVKEIGIIEGELPAVDLEWIAATAAGKIQQSSDSLEKIFWGRLFYVVTRKFGSGWVHLMSIIPECAALYAISPFSEPEVLMESYGPKKITPRLFQCRPDREKFSPAACDKVTWRQKNMALEYICYNDETANDYLHETYGPRLAEAYRNVPYPADRVAFMAFASLYWEGGIFADVMTTCRANISSLMRDEAELVVMAEPGRLEKYFMASAPRHPLVRRFLSRLIHYWESERKDLPHALISGSEAFTLNLLDAWCEDPTCLSEGKVFFLPKKQFSCLIDFTGQDEDLAIQERMELEGAFKTLLSPSLVKPEERLGIFSHPAANGYLGGVPAQILPPGRPIVVIGPNRHPEWSREQMRPVLTPAAHVYAWQDVGLSGHCALWKDGAFIKLDSYLSHVAEVESRDGHWKPTDRHNATHVIDEPVILAFSAGYGCYGHYIVDDLPRLGLIKKQLGTKEFLRQKFILPRTTARWAHELLKHFLGIEPENIVSFEPAHDRWFLKHAIVAEYPHRVYNFNPFVREFYQEAIQEDVTPVRKICLSRRRWEAGKLHQRVFEQQEWFEQEAERRGFEVIAPETLSISDQIKLMCQTKTQVGEHGSAQHASIYSSYGMTVGTINPLGSVQINLGRISGNKNVVIYESESRRDQNHNTFYRCREEDLRLFLDALA